MSAARSLHVGGRVLSLPTQSASVAIHTSDPETFREVVRAWQDEGGLTFKASGSGATGWVAVSTDVGERIATIYCSEMVQREHVPDTLTNQTIDAIEAILAEVSS